MSFSSSPYPIPPRSAVMIFENISFTESTTSRRDRKLSLRSIRISSEVLQKEYGSNAKDIFAYVSASAGPNWFYDSYPKWAKDSSIWKNCITYDHENKQFHINIKPAVLMQIIHSGVLPKNIQFNMDDTITHPAYYSNHASSKKGGNQPEKNGRHFAGLYYDEEDSAKVKILKPRKR